MSVIVPYGAMLTQRTYMIHVSVFCIRLGIWGLRWSQTDNVAIPGSISADLRVMLGAIARRRVLKLKNQKT